MPPYDRETAAIPHKVFCLGAGHVAQGTSGTLSVQLPRGGYPIRRYAKRPSGHLYRTSFIYDAQSD